MNIYDYIIYMIHNLGQTISEVITYQTKAQQLLSQDVYGYFVSGSDD